MTFLITNFAGASANKQQFEFTGAPGGIRTPNPQIRSLMLCPVELRALTFKKKQISRLS
jgi:hypothetical protein